ncbi:hypothetical protein V6N12_020197 [Hibiscus sabdariffa]|uniref:CCHC-type domain-containing protein n=1 Tax=Hibiscus sabdariffa TaxID=183260 RepID=A0ABR2BMN5_9ROSI
MNAKAMHILFCALGPDEYAKMSSCSSAKEIWDKLEVTHEGTSEVKEAKIDLLNLSYENFKMELDEDIKKMFDRFSFIINGLNGYAKNLKTLKLDELMGSLLTHELMKQGKRDEDKKKEEKKEVEKKKISIALKATLESDYSEEDDEEMAFLARRFTRFMKSNRGRKFLRKGEFKNKNREEENDQLFCYECKKPGHIRTECPQLKNKSFGKKKRLKAHVGTWSDEESSDEDEEEVANLYLMALDYEPKVTSSSSLCDLSYNELLNEYEELQEVQEDHQKEVGDLKACLNKVGKTNFENASASRSKHVRRNFNNYKQRGFQKTSRSKRVRSVWVPKDLITSNNIHAIASWIPKGTKILGANTYGPKRILVPKIKT